MKITDKINAGGANLRKPEKAKGEVSEKKSGEAIAKAEPDRVSLSGAAKELNKLQEIVNSIPDVRADKVEALKNSIAAGSYNVKGNDVAGKLIKSSIIDGLIAKK
jgi:negative regulator of flagellin synthesis FlgM